MACFALVSDPGLCKNILVMKTPPYVPLNTGIQVLGDVGREQVLQGATGDPGEDLRLKWCGKLVSRGAQLPSVTP